MNYVIILVSLFVYSCSSTNTEDKKEALIIPREEKSFSETSSRVEFGKTTSEIKNALESNDFEGARRKIYAGFKSEPKQGKYWLFAGVYFLKTGKVDMAKVYLDRAYEFGERSADLFANRALYYFSKKRDWEAMNELQVALKQNENHINSNFMMAEILITNSNFAGAMKFVRRLISADPDSQDLKKMYASCLIATGGFKEAVEILNKLRRNRAIGYESVYNLMYAFKMLGKNEDARRTLEDASDFERLNSEQKSKLRDLSGA